MQPNHKQVPVLSVAALALAVAAALPVQLASTLDSDQSRMLDPASRALYALSQLANCPADTDGISQAYGWDSDCVDALANPDLFANGSFALDTRINADDILQAIGNTAHGEPDPWNHCREDLLAHSEFLPEADFSEFPAGFFPDCNEGPTVGRNAHQA